MGITIERPRPEEAPELTRVILSSKSYWGYTDEWLERCKNVLGVSPAMIRSKDFFVGRSEGDIVFIYSLRRKGKGMYELDDCWVAPGYIGRGYGRMMFEHMVGTLRSVGGITLEILSDPNAEGFYRRMGAVRVGERPSRVDGRPLPVLEYRVK